MVEGSYHWAPNCGSGRPGSLCSPFTASHSWAQYPETQDLGWSIVSHLLTWAFKMFSLNRNVVYQELFPPNSGNKITVVVSSASQCFRNSMLVCCENTSSRLFHVAEWPFPESHFDKRIFSPPTPNLASNDAQGAEYKYKYKYKNKYKYKRKYKYKYKYK